MRKSVATKVLSLILSVAFVLSLLPHSVFTASAVEANEVVPTIEVQSASADPGGNVSVEIRLKNNPGITSMKLRVSYDSTMLNIKGVQYNEALSANAVEPNLENSKGSIVLYWDHGTEDMGEDCVFATLSFVVMEKSAIGKCASISVLYDSEEIYDVHENNVFFEVVNGEVLVAECIRGDINGDGKLSTKDVSRLKQHYAGWNVTVNELAMDVDGNGKTNTRDTTRLMQYFAEWDVAIYCIHGVSEKYADENCNHGTLDARAAVDATCTEDGNIAYWHCASCDKYFRDDQGKTEITLADTVIEADGHDLEARAAKEANCTDDGNEAYWFCTSCEKYFSDAEGETETTLAGVTVKAPVHVVVVDPGKAPTLTEPGLTEGSHCSRCGEVLVEQKPIAVNEYEIKYEVAYACLEDAATEVYSKDTYLESVMVKNPNPSTYKSSEGYKLEDLEDIPGYTFLGWFNGKTAGAEQVTRIPAGTAESVKLYAHWRADKYTIQFSSSVGDVPEEKTYYTRQTTPVRPAEWFGYTFVGWTDEEGNFVGNEIPKGSSGDITLYANWTSERNKTVPVKTLGAPIICEGDGQILFAYEIGRVENIPLYKIADLMNSNGITWEKTVSKSGSISNARAEEIAEAISKATTESCDWTLSKDWNETYEVSEEHSEEVTKEVHENSKRAFEESGKYNISNSFGGSSKTVDEVGVSAKISASYSQKISVGAPILADGLGYESELEFGAELGASYTHTSENTKSWNRNEGFEKSLSISGESEVGQSLSQSIGAKTGYGMSSSSGGSESVNNGVETSQSESREYASSVTYATEVTETESLTLTNANAPDGNYRIVAAGTAHVFAVVGYDIASGSYYTYTHSVMDEETKEYLDYSATTSQFDDQENGVLPFEVPYYVNEYVDDKIVATQGLKVNLDTGEVTGYEGEAVHVRVPEYWVSNDGGTKTVVKITGLAPNAFANKSSITLVKLPDTITEIPENAFAGCTALERVLCSSSLTLIDENAFSGCTSLKAIGAEAYSNIPPAAGVTVTTTVGELGDNAFVGVPKVTVNAGSRFVAKAAVDSGAKKLVLNLNSLADELKNTTLTVPAVTESFTFNGSGKTYSGVRIVSNARTTVINSTILSGCTDVPLELSSENVVLNQVTINASGMALKLTAEHAAVALYRTVTVNTSGTNAVLCNNITLCRADSSVEGSMNVSGNVLVCGELAGEEYMSVTNGEIIYCVSGSFSITFDANGGTVAEGSRTVPCGTAIGELPVPVRDGYAFLGWFTEDGEEVTADSTLVSTDVIVLYAKWVTLEYTASWTEAVTETGGVCCEIKVYRLASPFAGAEIGRLSNGAAVYYGDVLEIDYDVQDGYSLDRHGATEITVTTDVTNVDIWVRTTANEYTYNVEYVSSNGTRLGTDEVTEAYGSTVTVAAKDFSGYVTPAEQNVVWDVAADGGKTITFTYSPSPVTNATRTGEIYRESWSGVTYSAKLEYRNRTATSVQVRVTWTATLTNFASGSPAYNQMGQNIMVSAGGTSKIVKVVPFNSWQSVSTSNSKTASSEWITVSLSTTGTTSVNMGIYYYQVNYNGDDMSPNYASGNFTFAINIPAY